MMYGDKSSRRDFLKRFTTTFSAFATIKFGNMFPELQGADGLAQQRQALSNIQFSESFDLYKGFVLLPEGADVPEFVAFPDFPVPIHCGVGDSNEIHVIATHESFETVEDVVKQVNFNIYMLNGLPPSDFRLGDIVLTRYENGQVDQVLITYEQYLSEVDRWVTTISISSRFTFPAPYPVFFTPEGVVAEGVRDFPTLVEKVRYLPTSGLQISTAEGYVHLWMENSIFYTLINEPAIGESATELPKLLALVK